MFLNRRSRVLLLGGDVVPRGVHTDAIFDANLTTAWATVVVAFVAILALVATAYQARASRQAVLAPRRSAIDAMAPRLIIEAERPRWPPREVDYAHVGHYGPRPPGTRFDDQVDFQRQLALETHVRITNEGVTTALVTLPPGVIPVGSAGSDPPEGTTEWLLWTRGRPQPLTVHPGESHWLLALGTRPISEWAALHTRYDGDLLAALDDAPAAKVTPGVRFTIVSEDQSSHGVRDETIVDVICLPVQPTAESSSSVEIRPLISNQPDLPVAISRVGRTVRTYLGV